MSRRTTGETTEDKEDDKGSTERNRNKVGSQISDVITKRLTIIRTKARGNIPGRKEIVAGDKGEHSYYKWKSRALHGVEESIAQRRNNKGTGRLWRSFYRGMGFCGVTGS